MVISFSFTLAIPDPKIYGMMGLILGLMGFVARRHRLNGAL